MNYLNQLRADERETICKAPKTKVCKAKPDISSKLISQNVVLGSKRMLIQEHVALGEITFTEPEAFRIHK